MTKFIRLLSEKDKAKSLVEICSDIKGGNASERYFDADVSEFSKIPGSPFIYWVNDSLREIFVKFKSFEEGGRIAKQGLASADDFRFLRTWWEVKEKGGKWFAFAKGGSYSIYYSDIYLLVNWQEGGAEIKNNLNDRGGVRSNVWMLKETADNFFLKKGVTWPRRPMRRGSFRALPTGCVFADNGPSAFDSHPESLVAILNSSLFIYLLHLLMPRGTEGGATLTYEVGYVGSVPIPSMSKEVRAELGAAFRRGWSVQRKLDNQNETSHAFVMPAALLSREFGWESDSLKKELADIQRSIDHNVNQIYGVSDLDRLEFNGDDIDFDASEDDEDEFQEADNLVDEYLSILSWAVGVAFGRFDWRFATGQRKPPEAPDPFDEIPSRSDGMLLEDDQQFHDYDGVLVDDKRNQHDLPHVVEEVLNCVKLTAPYEVRTWLRRDFFSYHLQNYSRSRRKAPIYWPLATGSGSYTIWIYYPTLTNQTLYTAINDFVEPKLKEIGAEVTELRNKGAARTREEERQFETLQAFELELIELRDALLKLAPTFKPNQDDGVQITAAPLWPLFRHKPWQKVLKDTWAKLEKGDYDWAHLAMNYWPDRVREKCKTDKSLAIAHGLEHLYVEPEAQPKKPRGRKKAGGDE